MHNRTIYSCVKPCEWKACHAYSFNEQSMKEIECNEGLGLNNFCSLRVEKFGKDDYALIVDGWDDEAYYLRFNDPRYDNKEAAIAKFMSFLAVDIITEDKLYNFYPW